MAFWHYNNQNGTLKSLNYPSFPRRIWFSLIPHYPITENDPFSTAPYISNTKMTNIIKSRNRIIPITPTMTLSIPPGPLPQSSSCSSRSAPPPPGAYTSRHALPRPPWRRNNSRRSSPSRRRSWPRPPSWTPP